MATDDELKAEFIEAFDAVRDDLFAFIFALVPTYHEAQDLFQDMSVALWHKYGDYSRAMDFRAWARQIIRAELGNEPKGLKRKILLAPEAMAVVDREFGASRESSEGIKHALLACLQRLSTASRRLIQLKYIEERSNTEIAARMNRAEHGTKVMAHRIRTTLAECVRRHTISV